MEVYNVPDQGLADTYLVIPIVVVLNLMVLCFWFLIRGRGQTCTGFLMLVSSYILAGVVGFNIFRITLFLTSKKYFGFHRFKVLSQTHSLLLSLNNTDPCTTREHLTILLTRACTILLAPAMDISVQVITI